MYYVYGSSFSMSLNTYSICGSLTGMQTASAPLSLPPRDTQYMIQRVSCCHRCPHPGLARYWDSYRMVSLFGRLLQHAAAEQYSRPYRPCNDHLFQSDRNGTGDSSRRRATGSLVRLGILCFIYYGIACPWANKR